MQQRRGDLVKEVKSGIILQQVNAQGVMGSGIAKTIRDAYPVVWEMYHQIILPNPSNEQSRSHLGMIVPVQVTDDLIIINLVAQQFYGRDAGRRYTSYDALDICLKQVDQWAGPIHFPKIGCGLGGGQWSIVETILDFRLGHRDLTLWELPSPGP